MKQKDDWLWKSILEDTFSDFLEFMIPDAAKLFDFGKGITFLDKELQQVFPPEKDQYSPRIVDKLAQVYTQSGKEEWVLVHVEIQGRYDKNLPERMFTYYYRLKDKSGKKITSFAILTEPYMAERPDTFTEECYGCKATYKFNLYKIAGQDDVVLSKSSNVFAYVVRIAKAVFAVRNIKDNNEYDNALFDIKMKLARELLQAEIPKKQIRSLMIFLTNTLRFYNPEKDINFDKEIDKIKGRKNIMGIVEAYKERLKQSTLEEGRKEGLQKGLQKGREEGKLEGMQKGKEAEVRNLIVKLGLSDKQAAEVAEVPVSFVKKVRASIK